MIDATTIGLDDMHKRTVDWLTRWLKTSRRAHIADIILNLLAAFSVLAALWLIFKGDIEMKNFGDVMMPTIGTVPEFIALLWLLIVMDGIVTLAFAAVILFAKSILLGAKDLCGGSQHFREGRWPQHL